MQRALAHFHRSSGEVDGSYCHLEKPEATEGMKGDTLVGVSSTMGAEGPDSRWPSPAAHETRYRGIEIKVGKSLTVNTTSLCPKHLRHLVSPVSQASRALVSDISPITPSSPSN